jgi:hypothetical protein
MSSARDVRAHIAKTGLGKLPSLDTQTLERMKAEAMKKAKALQEKVGLILNSLSNLQFYLTTLFTATRCMADRRPYSLPRRL